MCLSRFSRVVVLEPMDATAHAQFAHAQTEHRLQSQIKWLNNYARKHKRRSQRRRRRRRSLLCPDARMRSTERAPSLTKMHARGSHNYHERSRYKWGCRTVLANYPRTHMRTYRTTLASPRDRHKCVRAPSNIITSVFINAHAQILAAPCETS